MFDKKEVKVHSEVSIEDLAQVVRENEERVKAQRKKIEKRMEDLKDSIQGPTYIKAGEVNSFDISEIERITRPEDSREGLAVKLHALDIALEQPACCDKEFMSSIKEYLTAVIPVVEKLENYQYEKIRLITEKESEFKRFQQAQIEEYAEADHKIEDILKVAHMTHNELGYDKLHPMNGLWGIETSIRITKLIEDAIKACGDGRRFSAYGSFASRPSNLGANSVPFGI